MTTRHTEAVVRECESHERLSRRHARAQGGAIAVLMMVLLTVIMGFASFGVDLSYVRLARFEMKNAADAAAHAGMFVLRATRDVSKARTAAEAIGGRNTVLGHAATFADADVVFGSWDWDVNTFTAGAPYNAVQVVGHTADPGNADGTVNTTFGRILGINSANIAQTSNGAFRPRTTMFEADVTGSLMVTRCGIDQAIAAEIDFGQAIYDAGVVKDRLGLDVFVGDATPVSTIQNLNANWLLGTGMKALWTGDGITAQSSSHTSGLGMCQKIGLAGTATGSYVSPNCLYPGTSVWPNLATIGSVAGVPITNPSCWQGDFHYAPTTTVYAGTNIGAAIKSGWDKIKATAKTYDVRTLVVFTDGGPMCCEGQGGGAICPNGGNPCCADGTNASCTDNTSGRACSCASSVAQYGIDMANGAYGDGIDIYLLVFSGNAQWVAYSQSLARGRGYTLDTTDPTQLSAKLTQIADSVPIALVAQ